MSSDPDRSPPAARHRPVGCLLALLPLAACASWSATAQAGYTQTSVRGDLALASGSGAAAGQDLESAFGLGDQRGSPWLRLAAETGPLAFAASLFWLRESGEGVLNSEFGGLSASTPVVAELDLGVAKASAAYVFDLGPLQLAPGLLVDVFDLDFRVRDLTLGFGEQIDEVVAVPMPFLRVGGSWDSWSANAEVAYLEIPDFDGNRGRFVDADAQLAWSPAPLTQLFVGYRYLSIDASGDSGSDSFSVDLSLQGWVVGGGLRF